MAYDETLATRVRELVPALGEKKMFGGLAFLLGGNMAVGVHGDDLIVRCDRAEHAAFLAEPGARPFDVTGRPMAGWLMVAGEVLDDDVLRTWVDRGVTYAGSLPPK
jgi:TfoX/Sxy family transcriptional regulator of competence genes